MNRAVFLRRAPRGQGVGAYRQDNLGRQFCFRMLLSSRRAVAAFRHHVGVIVRAGAREQMGRVNTGGIIATVQNALIPFPFRKCQGVSHSVRQLLISASRMLWCSPSKFSVSDFVFSADPIPTFEGAALLDLGPKDGCCVRFSASHCECFSIRGGQGGKGGRTPLLPAYTIISPPGGQQ